MRTAGEARQPVATRGPSARALAHVGTLAAGPGLDPALRVTLNFHPDRAAAAGVPLLTALLRDGYYLARFGAPA
jgi:hypothetical protein